MIKKQYETPLLDFYDSDEFYNGRANFIDYDYIDSFNRDNYIYGFDINTGIIKWISNNLDSILFI